MAAEKKSKKPIMPEKVKEGEVPTFVSPPSGKYNWRYEEGEFVPELLDKKELPIVIIPEHKRKKKDK